MSETPTSPIRWMSNIAIATSACPWVEMGGASVVRGTRVLHVVVVMGRG
jgi:hypothetical protein